MAIPHVKALINTELPHVKPSSRRIYFRQADLWHNFTSSSKSYVMVRAELVLWPFSEGIGMSDNLPTKRNLMASASSSCEMGSAHAIPKDMCEHWTHCWRWLEWRTVMPRKMRKQTCTKDPAHTFLWVWETISRLHTTQFCLCYTTV